MSLELPSNKASQVLRSCDRCFSLKTQCDLAKVCGRCRRLGLECTNVRPVRPKGRPRKSERSSEAPQAGDLSGLVGRVLDQTPTHNVDTKLAITLLEHIVSTGHSHGLYAAMLASPQSLRLDSASSLPRIPTDLSNILTPTIVGSLLSIALEVRQPSLHAMSQPSIKMSSNSLRAAALTQIPRVLSPYEPTVSDALSLLFLTHAWCFTSEHIEVSVRWCAFARVIITDVIKSRVPLPCALLDLEQRAYLGIALQDSILSLLHYARTVPPSQMDHRSLYQSIDLPQNNAETASSAQSTAYLTLFNPLIRIANIVLREPRPGSRNWRDAYDVIEEFYILFPQTLLKLGDLEFLYQAEAMIWMHGLFMILYVGRDPLNIILKPDVLNDDTLRHVLGHSLLLGEILPSIERLGDDFSYLSPAVVLFLIISCAVQIATLGKYLNDSWNEVATAGMELDMPSALSSPSPPDKLMESSRAHLRLLSLILQRCKRYDSPLLIDIRGLFASCYNCTLSASRPAEPIPATTLMLYRWTGQGTGVFPLDPTVAFAEWLFPQPPEHDIHESLFGHSEWSRDVVSEVCSPASRICEEGYFDLSIVIP